MSNKAMESVAFGRPIGGDEEVVLADGSSEYAVVRYGAWKRESAATGQFWSEDDWKLERAISKALHASP